jgi:hypothetical protein
LRIFKVVESLELNPAPPVLQTCRIQSHIGRTSGSFSFHCRNSGTIEKRKTQGAVFAVGKTTISTAGSNGLAGRSNDPKIAIVWDVCTSPCFFWRKFMRMGTSLVDQGLARYAKHNGTAVWTSATLPNSGQIGI